MLLLRTKNRMWLLCYLWSVCYGYKLEVSVSFERDSSVTYTFQEPFSVMQNRSLQVSGVSRESNRAIENMAFSFITSQSPALLLAVSTFSQQYIAVILAKNGSLQIWYRLHLDRTPDVFSPRLGSLADGRLHRIRIHRERKDVYVQIDQDIHRKYTLPSDAELILIRSLTLGKVIGRENFDDEVMHAGSKGFTGCLSSVQFNHVAPLKAALLNRGSSLVSVRGQMVESNCGVLADTKSSHPLSDQAAKGNKDKEPHGNDIRNDSAVIGGVVTAVVFITLCILAVMTHFLYQQRQTQRSASLKEKERRHSLETAYRAELHLHSSVRDNMKEYYI